MFIMMKALYRQRGFTLIETLVAMALLALLTSGGYAGIMMAHRMIASARYHQEAQTLATDKALELYQTDYDNVRNLPPVETEAVSADSILYELGGTLRTAIQFMGAYCLVTVRIDWNDPAWGGSSHAAHEEMTVRRYDTEY